MFTDYFSVILDYCVRIVPDLQELALNLLEWFTQPVDFMGNQIAVYDLFFGTSLTLILTFGIVKFFSDIIL